MATPGGTARYFESYSLAPSKIKRFDGLSVSALGAGTHLGSPDDAIDRLYEEELTEAGLNGINFFDTSIYDRCQRSERVLGKALRLLEQKGIGREQLVIATKGGMIPCEGPLDQYEDSVRIHYLDKKLIQAKEIVADCHCMSPQFLENQIDSSLENLQISTIDLYSLHNPEIQLLEIGEEEFYRRLALAFALFEKKIREKKIARYGLATWNGFRQKWGQKGTLQLAKVLECAKNAGGANHGFKAIQVPFNLVMLEAAKNQNQVFEGNKKTVFQAASQNGIALLVSAPLMQSKVGILSKRVFENLPEAGSEILQSLEFVLSAPEICTAFCGMKQSEHLEENRKALSHPAWTPEIWKKACKSIGG